MGNLRILSPADACAEPIAWPDVYFSPAYAQVVQLSDHADWRVAIWEPGPIVMPMLWRAISADGMAAGQFDVISPYGYSGCWAPEHVPLDTWRAFRRALRDELRNRGAVAEFLRLGSLVPGREALLAADDQLQAARHNDTIAIDTTCDPETFWNHCEGRARTAVRKATRLGYRGEARSVTADDFRPGATFRTLYHQTMLRVNAKPYYLFDDAYFQALYDHLKDHLVMFVVHGPDGKVAVMALTMHWAPLLHLHLVGSDPPSMRDGAGNLCYDTMLRWACARPDVRQCHLGGGLSADDALFRFKKSFGGERRAYWVASQVIDPVRYGDLVSWRGRQLNCTADDLLAGGFFPAYRTPAAQVTRRAA